MIPIKTESKASYNGESIDSAFGDTVEKQASLLLVPEIGRPSVDNQLDGSLENRLNDLVYMESLEGVDSSGNPSSGREPGIEE